MFKTIRSRLVIAALALSPLLVVPTAANAQGNDDESVLHRFCTQYLRDGDKVFQGGAGEAKFDLDDIKRRFARWDRREDIRDRRENFRDRCEDFFDRLEDRKDPKKDREDIRDRREDRRDRREDIRDRRENRRDRRFGHVS